MMSGDSEALQRQIAELTSTLEEQRLQVIALEEARKASEDRANAANAQVAALQAASVAGPSTPARTSVMPTAPMQIAATQVAPVNNVPRIPDLIRMIPEFEGNPRNLPRWIESVDQKLAVSKRFVPADDLPWILPIWIGIIRDKITEKANDALSASHTPLEWDAIKTTLIEYFGDKTDLSSLVSKLTSLKQGSNSVTEFYHVCRSLLAEINAKISLNNHTPDEAKAIMGTYETLTTNAFVDGLHDTTSDLTRSTRPKSLMAAFHVASEHEAALRRRREKNARQLSDNFKPKPTTNIAVGVQQKSYHNQPIHRPPMNPNGPINFGYRPQYYQNSPGFRPQPNHYSAKNPQNNVGPRPQQLAIPYIKPDPSGQNRFPSGQSNSKQVVPYHRTAQVNVHESAEETPADFTYNENTPEDNSQQEENHPLIDEFEQLNFYMDPDQQTPE